MSRLKPTVLSCPVPASPRTVIAPGLTAAYVVPDASLLVPAAENPLGPKPCEFCGPGNLFAIEVTGVFNMAPPGPLQPKPPLALKPTVSPE
ncbi:hypothetical protein [Burkholderia vietnamiensis]|uniref:hypothetical protein n=1 Tax=Burkholderia vietnamiensis TaxID=60552 RepID=UPI002ED8B016